jgi:hypothetical protein
MQYTIAELPPAPDVPDELSHCWDVAEDGTVCGHPVDARRVLERGALERIGADRARTVGDTRVRAQRSW